MLTGKAQVQDISRTRLTFDPTDAAVAQPALTCMTFDPTDIAAA